MLKIVKKNNLITDSFLLNKMENNDKNKRFSYQSLFYYINFIIVYSVNHNLYY